MADELADMLQMIKKFSSDMLPAETEEYDFNNFKNEVASADRLMNLAQQRGRVFGAWGVPDPMGRRLMARAQQKGVNAARLAQMSEQRRRTQLQMQQTAVQLGLEAYRTKASVESDRARKELAKAEQALRTKEYDLRKLESDQIRDLRTKEEARKVAESAEQLKIKKAEVAIAENNAAWNPFMNMLTAGRQVLGTSADSLTLMGKRIDLETSKLRKEETQRLARAVTDTAAKFEKGGMDPTDAFNNAIAVVNRAKQGQTPKTTDDIVNDLKQVREISALETEEFKSKIARSRQLTADERNEYTRRVEAGENPLDVRASITAQKSAAERGEYSGTLKELTKEIDPVEQAEGVLYKLGLEDPNLGLVDKEGKPTNKLIEGARYIAGEREQLETEPEPTDSNPLMVKPPSPLQRMKGSSNPLAQLITSGVPEYSGTEMVGSVSGGGGMNPVTNLMRKFLPENKKRAASEELLP